MNVFIVTEEINMFSTATETTLRAYESEKDALELVENIKKQIDRLKNLDSNDYSFDGIEISRTFLKETDYYIEELMYITRK